VDKCPQCKAIYAYLIDNTKDEDDWSDMDNIEPTNDHSAPRIKNPQKALPKKCGLIYSKSVKEQENRTEELNKLVQAKINQLYGVGLSLATVNLARAEIVRFTKGKITTKRLTTLLAAAIYVKANTTTTMGSCWKHKGEGVTERQLEEIFDISRKTIRNWAGKLSRTSF